MVNPQTHPSIIQGGMGVAISDWRLARAVSVLGELGVVSGTALEVVCARRLQLGDPGGHVRRALAAFPVAGAADRIVDTYHRPDGTADDQPFVKVPGYTLEPAPALVELVVAANFVEVFLAKEGHDGVVGVNYLRKIGLPLPAALYGALLAGVDYVIVGAGNPVDVPGLVDDLCVGRPTSLPIRVHGSRESAIARFDPAALGAARPPRRPTVLGIVASNDLAEGLLGSDHPPDGIVVEGPAAGGHNAPPRGPRRVDERNQPIYDDLDRVDVGAVIELGLPAWLAGSTATPEALADARASGATGIQAGTVFALSAESGLEDSLKDRVLEQVADGTLEVRSDWRASPTGFPFKVVDLEDTLSDADVYAERRRVCDLGMLRTPYATPDGSIGYRCPAESERAYGIKGGWSPNTEDRLCLCNGLLATAGFPQRRPSGYVEPPVVTAGTDYGPVRELVAATGRSPYTAADVVAYLRGELRAASTPPE